MSNVSVENNTRPNDPAAHSCQVIVDPAEANVWVGTDRYYVYYIFYFCDFMTLMYPVIITIIRAIIQRCNSKLPCSKVL